MSSRVFSRSIIWSMLASAGVVGAGLIGLPHLTTGVFSRNTGLLSISALGIAAALLSATWFLSRLVGGLRRASPEWPAVLSAPEHVVLSGRVVGATRALASAVSVALLAGVLSGGLSVMVWWLLDLRGSESVRIVSGAVGLAVALITIPLLFMLILGAVSGGHVWSHDFGSLIRDKARRLLAVGVVTAGMGCCVEFVIGLLPVMWAPLVEGAVLCLIGGLALLAGVLLVGWPSAIEGGWRLVADRLAPVTRPLTRVRPAAMGAAFAVLSISLAAGFLTGPPAFADPGEVSLETGSVADRPETTAPVDAPSNTPPEAEPSSIAAPRDPYPLYEAQVLAEYGPAGALAATYTHGLGLLNVRGTGSSPTTDWLTDQGPDTGWYLPDGQGSLTGVTNTVGSLIQATSYDPWGVPTQTLGATMSTVFGWNGEEYSPTTGLQYLRARWYQPTTGRFTSADTLFGDTTNPTSLNRYSYAGNDPINNVDPSGHMSVPNRPTMVYHRKPEPSRIFERKPTPPTPAPIPPPPSPDSVVDDVIDDAARTVEDAQDTSVDAFSPTPDAIQDRIQEIQDRIHDYSCGDAQPISGVTLDISRVIQPPSVWECRNALKGMVPAMRTASLTLSDILAHLENICMIAHAAPEPYQSLFFKHASNLEYRHGVDDKQGGPLRAISEQPHDGSRLREELISDVKIGLMRVIGTDPEAAAIADAIMVGDTSGLSAAGVESYTTAINEMNTCVLQGQPLHCDGGEPVDEGTRRALAESVSDIYGLATDNTVLGTYGHRDRLFGILTGEMDKEFFAEFFSYQMTGAVDKLAYTCEWLGKGCEFVESLL